MENLLISACLLGINCRYDGGNSYFDGVEQLKLKYHLVPICPEILGGLPTPRPPCEIQSGNVISINGQNVTENYQRGAVETLKLAIMFNCQKALLKEFSPSCGLGKIHDGAFDGKLTNGAGIAADLLRQNGLKIYGESHIDELLK
ncbi:MAG: DUF523 domain-containing protein [Clostridia bacterium]